MLSNVHIIGPKHTLFQLNIIYIHGMGIHQLVIQCLCLLFWPQHPRLSGTWLFSLSNASVTSPNDRWALLSFLLSTNASHMSAQQVNLTRTFVHSRIWTILRKLLSLIWKSSNSCQCGVAIPLADCDIIFSKDQRVSIISPSTLPAPGIKFRAYWGKHSDLWHAHAISWYLAKSATHPVKKWSCLTGSGKPSSDCIGNWCHKMWPLFVWGLMHARQHIWGHSPCLSAYNCLNTYQRS